CWIRCIRSLHDNHQIVAVDHLLIWQRAEHLADLLGPQTTDPRGVGGRVVGQSPGEFGVIDIAQRHDVALREGSDDLDHTYSKEAAPLVLHRAAGAGIHDETALGLGREAEPALPGRERRPMW